MKNFKFKKTLIAVIPVLIGLFVFEGTKMYLSKMKTMPPAVE